MAFQEYERIARSAGKLASHTSANIEAIEENAATREVAALYEYFRTHFGRPDVPGILKCFATHPALLRHMMDLSESLIFTEGHLTRKHKEMIATLVSTQNSCPYCADSHGYFLRVHGGSAEVLDAIRKCKLDSPVLTDSERALLGFARKVNMSSHEIDRRDVVLLIRSGWMEPQIAETVHVVALFSTFNRVANAFGLSSQGLLSLFDSESDHTADRNSKVERNSQ